MAEPFLTEDHVADKHPEACAIDRIAVGDVLHAAGELCKDTAMTAKLDPRHDRAFLIGSLPFGVFIAKAHGIDLRTVGSANTGATTVGRALRRKGGLVCFVLDAAKGAGPVLAPGLLGGTLGVGLAQQEPGAAWWWILVGLATMMGHIYSPFLRFKGGKGVATAFGAFGAMWPVMTIPIAAALLVFLVVRRLSGYVSLASIVGAWTIPTTALATALAQSAPMGVAFPPVVVGTVIAGLVTWRHRSNLARIKAGTELPLGREADDARTS